MNITKKICSYLVLLAFAGPAFADPKLPKLTLSPDDFKINLNDPDEVGQQLREIDERLAILNLINNLQGIKGFKKDGFQFEVTVQDADGSWVPDPSAVQPYLKAYLAYQIVYHEMVIDHGKSPEPYLELSKLTLDEIRLVILQKEITLKTLEDLVAKGYFKSPFLRNTSGYAEYSLPDKSIYISWDQAKPFLPTELENRWRQISLSLLNRVLSHPDPTFKEKALSHLQCSSACCLLGFGT